MARRRVVVAAAFLTALALVGCSSTTTQRSQKTIKVGLVTDTGGLEANGLNHLAAVGLSQAASRGTVCSTMTCQGQLGVLGDVTESKAITDFAPNLSDYAGRGYDLVIGVGFRMSQAIGTVSGQFPNTRFAIIDAVGADANGSDLRHANVLSMLFREQEAGAVAGTIAGALERDNAGPKPQHTIGSVIGVKIAPLDHYLAGYQWAAKRLDPSVKILNTYANNFTDPARCAVLAENQITQGADILFQAAGGCGDGVLTQAGKDGVWSLGVDTDQKGVDKSVIASAVKRADVATISIIRAVMTNSFHGGVRLFGLANDGISYAPGNITLPPKVLSAVQNIVNQVKSGSMTVPEFVS